MKNENTLIGLASNSKYNMRIVLNLYNKYFILVVDKLLLI